LVKATIIYSGVSLASSLYIFAAMSSIFWSS
jgi:hypothetical protein